MVSGEWSGSTEYCVGGGGSVYTEVCPGDSPLAWSAILLQVTEMDNYTQG